MPKKFYDIVPPKMIKKSQAKTRGVKAAKKKVMAAVVEEKKIKEKKGGISTRAKVITIAIIAVVVIVLGYLYVKLPYVRVDVTPQTQPVSLNLMITADKDSSAVDLQDKVIPAQVISESKELFQEFPSTGTSASEGYAKGTITVYNKYNNPATALNLKAKTRFISDSGKYFTADSKISIPAAKMVSGKLVPSSVDVPVTAVDSGADYNIGPSNFAIPGLVGTALYSSVYGVSASAMAGGYQANAKIATASDIANAKSVLSQKVFDEITADLKTKAASSNFVLFDNAVTKTITEDSPAVKAGAQVDTFNYKIGATINALVFSQADLSDFTNQYASSQIPQGQVILAKSFNLDYAPSSVDLTNNKIMLQMKITALTYAKTDEGAIPQTLEGKNESQIHNIIYNDFNQQVSIVKVNFWPFWVTSGPNNPDRIKVKLIFP